MALRDTKARLNEADIAPPALPAGAADRETGGVITIDLAALVANWTTLSKRVMPADCAAVVKADAYGCGAAPVVKALAAAGCKTFFVATLAEARKVRAAAPKVDIYVLGGLVPGTGQAFADIRARPVIGSLLELAEWDGFRASTRWPGGAALHFDTGMNRLGLSPEEAQTLGERSRMPDHGIVLVMSHFACADVPNHPLNLRQIQLFRELRMMYRGIPASLANSSGILLGPSAHCDMVRPGIALYGGNPSPGAANPMRTVVDIVSRIVQVREVPRGQSVGYGATWTAARPSRIAIVSVGYADGYLRAGATASEGAGGKGTGGKGTGSKGSVSKSTGKGGEAMPEVLIEGLRCPIVGRISMDLMAVDVTALTDVALRRGDRVGLLGDGIAIEDLAAWGGMIPYEVLTGLGRRFHRVYNTDA